MFTVSTFSLAFFAFVAIQEPGRQAGPGGQPPVSLILAALDADGDGIISAAELDNAPAAIKKLDRNGDGLIDPSELRPAGRGRQGGGDAGRAGGRGGRAGEPGDTPATSPDDLVALLMAFDKNGDGVLVKSELPDRLQTIFDRADADKNGKLTADEIRKSAAAATQPNAIPGGREGGGREGRGREGGGREGGPAGNMDPIVRAIDTNHDGSLQADEIAAAAASLRTLDKNGDGRLTVDEYRLPTPQGRGL